MMERRIINLRKITVMVIAALFFGWGTTSCYIDKEDELYPDAPDCDVTNVTYSQTVAPILQNNCNGCHNAVSQSGGIITDNYADLQTIINNGKFRGSINHLSGYSPMPKGGGKLSSCDLEKINTWLDAGASNN
jgi:hypothetical protein